MLDTAGPAGRAAAGGADPRAARAAPIDHVPAARRYWWSRASSSYLPEERRYGLGVVTYELGSAYHGRCRCSRIARPVLRRLVDKVQQNAHLAVLHGRDVYYVIEERAPGRPPLVTDVGVRLPATLDGQGLAMLARLPRPQLRASSRRRRLVQRDGRGPATLAELSRVLVDTRRRGTPRRRTWSPPACPRWVGR